MQNINKNTCKNDTNTDKIESILGIWDMEIKNINNELQDRNTITCTILSEAFRCLTEMNDVNAELDALFTEYHSFDIELYLERIKRNQEKEKQVEQEIQNVVNELKLANDDIINQEIKIENNKRINAIKTKEFEKDIAEQKVFLQHKNACENVFVKQEKEKEDDETANHMKINEIIVEFEKEYQSLVVGKDVDNIDRQSHLFNDLILSLEWNILTQFVNNIIAYGLYRSDGNTNRNMNFCMNNNSTMKNVKIGMKREQNNLVDAHSFVHIAGESSLLLSVADTSSPNSYLVRDGDRNQWLYISLHFTHDNSLCLTNTMSTDDLLINIQAANITTMRTHDLLFKSDTNLCDNNSIVLDFSLERIINISFCKNTGNLDFVGKSVQGLKQTRYEYKFHDDNG